MLRSERSRRVLFVLALAAGITGSLLVATPSPASEESRVDLVLVRHTERSQLEASGLPVTFKGAGFFLALWDARQRAEAQAATIPFEVLARGFDADRPLQLVESHFGAEPPAEWRDRVLWHEGRKWILELNDREVEELPPTDFSHRPLPGKPRGWAVQRAPSVAYDCSYNPLIDTMLQGTSQTRWLDWIEKLSGVETVIIDGTEYTIRTRYSSRLFTGDTSARAYDFALQEAESWHYGPANIEEHSYTGSGGQTWKNLVLTIPGQTSPDEIVLITGHLDSASTDSSNAPGANDNGTGNAAAFEAARLLRRLHFARTVKIIFFTGEEQGLYGSEAYVDDHPTTDMLGVVNLDMFGWDGDSDRCFEIHAGTLTDSQDVADCFDASITSYGLGLSRDYLTATATDRSDHASFWQVGVGAIEIAENFFNDNLSGGCVGQDNNPGYHTTSDTIAQNMHPSFGYDIARTGLATIAAMAQPIALCFDDAPQLSSVPGVSQVDLSWTAVAGASTYRVYRSTQSCEGQWFPIAETSGTTWNDSGADQAQAYLYMVEAVDADGFCVSAESNCTVATPTVYHARNTGVAVLDSCSEGGLGDADGVLDPGESAMVPVTLENDGNTELTQISGTLSISSTAVTVTDANANWPDIGANGARESLPDHFGLEAADSGSCGTILNGAIALNYAEGANLTEFALPIGDVFEDLLIDEDFLNGIPPSWMVIDNGSGGGSAATWTANNPGNRSIGSPFDSQFAIVDSDNAGSGAEQDEWLITPPFDARQCTEVYLEFSNQFRHYGSSLNEIADVDWSTDGGISWDNQLRIEGADDGYPEPVTKLVPLDMSGATDISNVLLRFRYYQGSYEWWWAIDNVKVRCARLACTPCGSAAGPSPGEAATTAPLTLDRFPRNLILQWGPPDTGCVAQDYALYRGDLTLLHTVGYNHDQILSCATGGNTLMIPELNPAIGEADYYLVVSLNGSREGSYGKDSEGGERSVSTAACQVLQDLGECTP